MRGFAPPPPTWSCSPTPTAGRSRLAGQAAGAVRGRARRRRGRGGPHQLPRRSVRRGRDRGRLHVLPQPARRRLHAELLREQRGVSARGARRHRLRRARVYRGSCQVMGLALQERRIACPLRRRRPHGPPPARYHRRAAAASPAARRRRRRAGAAPGAAYLPARARWLARLGLPSAARRAGGALAVRAGRLRRQGQPAVAGRRWLAGARGPELDPRRRRRRRGDSLAAPRPRAARAAGAALSYHRDVDGLAA